MKKAFILVIVMLTSFLLVAYDNAYTFTVDTDKGEIEFSVNPDSVQNVGFNSAGLPVSVSSQTVTITPHNVVYDTTYRNLNYTLSSFNPYIMVNGQQYINDRWQSFSDVILIQSLVDTNISRSMAYRTTLEVFTLFMIITVSAVGEQSICIRRYTKIRKQTKVKYSTINRKLQPIYKDSINRRYFIISITTQFKFFHMYISSQLSLQTVYIKF